MNLSHLSIATISLARDSAEEEILRSSLQALALLGAKVFITDGGSSDSFIRFLKSLPGFAVFTAKGLWPQARKSIVKACEAGASAILYTEPDKLLFFQQHLPQWLQQAEMKKTTGVILAARSAAGFRSFPAFQQQTESAINLCCHEVIGLDTDYCYGPFLFTSQLTPALHFLPVDCGWGWRPALFATAHRKGFRVEAISGNFTCPPGQQADNAEERIYRMKQLSQNIEGLVMGATTARDLTGF